MGKHLGLEIWSVGAVLTFGLIAGVAWPCLVGVLLCYKLASSLFTFLHLSQYSFHFFFFFSSFMAPKWGAGRGRVRRSRGGRTPCSGRGGRRGAPPSSSSSGEGFWRHDFLLRVRGQSATRVLLPPAFSAIVADLGLDGLLLHL